jgi:predicted nucleic acid-binding protein
MDRTLILDAAHLKAKYAIAYTDAFVVALASREDAVILIGEPEFETVRDIVRIEWLGNNPH